MKTKTFLSQERLAQYICRMWLKSGQEAVRRRGRFYVALCGGTSPVNIYRQLASFSQFRLWDKTHIFLTDERFVPWGNKASNYKMIRETLVGPVNIPKENIHPVQIKKTVQLSAGDYENTLKTVFHLKRGQLPKFDLIILGVGEDGHIASLFPGSWALREKKRLAVATRQPQSLQHRVTLTIPVINSARQIVFLFLGRRKARIVKDLFLGNSELPAAFVLGKRRNCLLALDRMSSFMLKPSFMNVCGGFKYKAKVS